MEITTPTPMVWETTPATWSTEMADDWVATTAAQPTTPDFKPVRDWPVFGLRPLELAALRFIHHEGPLTCDEFKRRFTRGGKKAREAALHDLNRLGMVRLVLCSDDKIRIQVTAEPDYDGLERTAWTP